MERNQYSAAIKSCMKSSTRMSIQPAPNVSPIRIDSYGSPIVQNGSHKIMIMEERNSITD